MSLPGARRRPPWALVAAAAFASCAPGAHAQGSNNSSANPSGNASRNGSNFTGPCLTGYCSTRIRREAAIACREVQGFGLKDANCQSWADYAQVDCTTSCSNCTAIALSVYGQCLFYLAQQLLFPVAYSYCQAVRSAFQVARCPSATVDTLQACYTEKYVACNAICGNYFDAPGVPSKGCDCYRDRQRYSAPDVCTGETILRGVIPSMPWLEHSCTLMPETCYNHRNGTDCGLYTYCPVDVCVVKNITCGFIDDCQSDGVCNKLDGQCHYTPRPDGVNCTDGISWTHGDTCFDGTCVGIEDKCLHYPMDCSTLNPCLQPKVRMTYAGNVTNCDPGTGSCMFEPRDDDTACATITGGGTDGRCLGGVCRRSQDKCAGRTECPDFGICYAPAKCDNFTGTCIKVPKVEGTPCDDGRAGTYGDQCIEGRCVGDLFAEPSFQILGAGDCLAHLPAAGQDERPVSRYYHDVVEASVCQVQCGRDPDCQAYSYGLHVCSIYGTKRTVDPNAEVWGQDWRLEATEAFIKHEVTCWRKTEGEVWDFVTVVRKYLVAVTFTVILGAPVCFVLASYWTELRESHRRMRGLEPESEVVPPPSPKGSGQVAQTNVTPGPEASAKQDKRLQLSWEQEAAAVPGAWPGSPAMSDGPTRDPRGEVDDPRPAL